MSAPAIIGRFVGGRTVDHKKTGVKLTGNSFFRPINISKTALEHRLKMLCPIGDVSSAAVAATTASAPWRPSQLGERTPSVAS
jgi:hypothetical protein